MTSKESKYFDIIDTDEDISQYSSFLIIRLKLVKNLIFYEFCKNDINAKKFQKYYKYFIIPFAIFLGTFAILFATIQLSHSSFVPKWLPKLETIFAVSLLIIVILGMQIQRKWLVSRYKAESLRNLKFMSLLDPLFWSGKYEQWWDNLVKTIEQIKKVDSKHSLKDLQISQVKLSSEISWNKPNVIADFTDYYLKKRICFQINYFEQKYKSRKEFNEGIAYGPLVFFICSLFFVIIHFLIIYFWENLVWVEWSILCVVVCSFLGISIRTIRSSMEFARHEYLLEYKKEFLSKMRDKISQILVQKPPNYEQELLEILNDCEIALSEEHSEWLRLMIEAEWYL